MTKSEDRETKFLNQLLGADVSAELSKFENYRAVVSEKVEYTRQHFNEKLGGLIPQSLEHHGFSPLLESMVLDLEKKFQDEEYFNSLHDYSSMSNALSKAYSWCNHQDLRGLFLKEESVIKILEICPPEILLNLFRADSVQDALKTISPSLLLTLTRFSENEEWQKKYFEELATCTTKDFEERRVEWTVVDWEDYKEIFSQSGHELKPWRMSHSKETGHVLCFTHTSEHEYRAPVLQFICVFMHYFFETLYAGLSSKQSLAENEETLGKHVVQMIKSGKRKYSFFPPNTYSEHLFWEKGMDIFFSTFRHIEGTEFFKDTLSCGGFVGENDPGSCVSLNIIDLIWDLNIPKESPKNAYFKQPGRHDYFALQTSGFLYHFQGALWYDIVQSLSQKGRKNFEEELIENLNLGDIDLTQHIAKTAYGNT